MLNSTNAACLYVLFSALNVKTENDISRCQWNGDLCNYFPGYNIDMLCKLGKKLLLRLDQPKFNTMYNEMFRALPFERRYQIGIEAYAHCSSSDDLLNVWFGVYKDAIDRHMWFYDHEVEEIERRIKTYFDTHNERTRLDLSQECVEWTSWESAKEFAFVKEIKCGYAQSQALYDYIKIETGEYCCFVVVLKALKGNRECFVTRDVVCLWGMAPDVVWAKAMKNGVFIEEETGDIRHPQEEHIRDNSHKTGLLLKKPEELWGKNGFFRHFGFDEWIQNGMSRPKPKVISNAEEKKNPIKKNNSKTPFQFLKSIDKCWKKIDELMRLMGKEMEIRDQDAKKYTLLCTTRSRRNVFKRNSKELIEPIKSIEEQLIEYAQEYESTRGLDNAFEKLCAIVNVVDTLVRRVESYRTQFGLTYQLDPRISKIKAECANHYSAILEDMVKKEVKRKGQIQKENEKNGKLILKRKKELAELELVIEEIKQTVEKYSKEYNAIQAVYETEKMECEAETGRKERTAVGLYMEAAQAERVIAEQEYIVGTNRQKLDAVRIAEKKLDAEHDAFLKRSLAEEKGLLAQIDEAEETLRKTLFFKKPKQQRLDELTDMLNAAIQMRMQGEKNHSVEKEKLKDACEASLEMILKAEEASALEKSKRDHIIRMRENLLQEIESDKEALKLKQEKVDIAKSLLEKQQEKLKEETGKVDQLKNEMENSRKQIKDNDTEFAKLSKSVVKILNSYPKGYEQKTEGYSVHTDFDFAFNKSLAIKLDSCCKAQSEIRMLRNQLIHLNIQESLIEKLKTSNLIDEEISKKEEIEKIERQIELLQGETSLYYECSGAADSPDVGEERNNKLLKKAEKSFETFWNQIAQWWSGSPELLPESDNQYCVHVSKDYYLYFNPFYVIGVELRKNKNADIQLFRYSDLAFELDTKQISLEYGKECPNGAQVLAEHWMHETVNGAPNRRYTNNPKYYVIALSEVKLYCSDKVRISYYASIEEADKIVQAFEAHENLLLSEYQEVINQIFADKDMPDIAAIAEQAALSKKKEEAARRAEERLIKQQELEKIRRREEEKRRKEQHQKELERWVDQAQKNKEADEKLVSHQLSELKEINASEIAEWDDTCFQPVAVMDRRRVITNGIIKVEFVQQAEDEKTSKYLVLFSDLNGKSYSDIRSLDRKAVGEKNIIPFEIKTQDSCNPAKLYLLIRNFDTGKLVGRVEYKLNIAFTNDFDF